MAWQLVDKIKGDSGAEGPTLGLITDVVYYVSANGSDETGDGTITGGAFLTANHAFSLIPKDLGGHSAYVYFLDDNTIESAIEITEFSNGRIILTSNGGLLTSQLDGESELVLVGDCRCSVLIDNLQLLLTSDDLTAGLFYNIDGPVLISACKVGATPTVAGTYGFGISNVTSIEIGGLVENLPGYSPVSVGFSLYSTIAYYLANQTFGDVLIEPGGIFINGPTSSSGFITSPESAPTNDYHYTNKKYVDDFISQLSPVPVLDSDIQLPVLHNGGNATVTITQVAEYASRRVTQYLDPPRMVVSEAGEVSANGVYLQTGEQNGKPFYSSSSASLNWSEVNQRWELLIGADLAYFSTIADEASPDLVVQWTIGSIATFDLYVWEVPVEYDLNWKYTWDDLLTGWRAESGNGIITATGGGGSGQGILQDSVTGRYFAVSTNGSNPLNATEWETIVLELTVDGTPVVLTSTEYPIYSGTFGVYETEVGAAVKWTVRYGEYAENDSRWLILQDDAVAYSSTDAVDRAHLCQTWVAESGSVPVSIRVFFTANITNKRPSADPVPTVIAGSWPAQTPVFADGLGGLTAGSQETPIIYPYTFAASMDWLSATDAAEDLVDFLGLELEPYELADPGHSLSISFENQTQEGWGLLSCSLDEDDEIVGVWLSAPRNDVLTEDVIRVHGVTATSTGPTGPSEVSTDAGQLTRANTVGAMSYIGVAQQGSLDSDLNWNVTRITLQDDGTVRIATALNIAWADHLTESYN